MKPLRILVMSVVMVCILIGILAAPVHAWPWSDRANLEITVNPLGALPYAIDCTSGTLIGHNYAVTVTNPWFSNKCVFKVSNAYVGSGVTYTLEFNYRYGPNNPLYNKTKKVNVYVNRPTFTTYSTTVNYVP